MKGLIKLPVKTFLVLTFVVFMVFGILSGVVFADEKIIKIGTLFPLTGPCALAGQRCKVAVETAVEVINNKHPECKVPLGESEGILGGYKIVLVHADHQGKPDVGKTEAERLFNVEKVYSIIGCYNSGVTKTASSVAERQKKIFMCGCSSSSALTERGFNYFFRFAPTDKTESIDFCEVIKWLNETKNANMKTIACIAENSEFGKHASEEAKAAVEAAGLEYVGTVTFSAGATNFDSEVLTLKAKNPDAVFGGCVGGDYTLWVRTMKQMDWLPKIIMNYCTGYQDPLIAKQLEDDANYFMGCTGYAPVFANMMPAVAAVEDIFKTKISPSVPYDSDSIQETIAMFILAQAIEKAGTLDYEKVRETLYANEWESPMSIGGKVAFIEGGQNSKALSLMTQIVGGEYKIAYPPELATEKIVFPMIPWDKR